MRLEKNNRLPEEEERDFTVGQHKIVYGIGVLIMGAGVLLLILEILYHVSAIPLWIYAMIFAIFLLGMSVCFEAKNRQLAVEKNSMYYSNIFGRTKHFTLEDIGLAKAALNPSAGRDYLRLYDKKGKILCRLEASMRNADCMICYLHDNGIAVEMEKNTRPELADIVFQEPISDAALPELSRKAYGQADALAKSWTERNKRLGAELIYGFAEYDGNKIDVEAQIQPEESRIIRNGKGEFKESEENYLCVLELYVQKGGRFVRDRKNRLLVMYFPVFYKRKARTAKGEIRLYYNGNWKMDLEEALRSLEKYLPEHKFILEQMELEYELKEEVGK